MRLDFLHTIVRKHSCQMAGEGIHAQGDAVLQCGTRLPYLLVLTFLSIVSRSIGVWTYPKYQIVRHDIERHRLAKTLHAILFLLYKLGHGVFQSLLQWIACAGRYVSREART